MILTTEDTDTIAMGMAVVTNGTTTEMENALAKINNHNFVAISNCKLTWLQKEPY